jgi:RNA polymerase sigma-19 factor, ECF subfamily
MSPEEIELLQSLKYGDEKSFKKIFEKHYRSLCITSMFFINDIDASEDIVQELFVKLWEQRVTLSINTSLKSYLNTAIKNSCKNYILHQKVKKKYENNFSQSDRVNISRDGLFTDPYLNEKIISSINLLPPKCKLIFEMSRFKGYKYREIADELNISQKTVEAQMGKALAFLYQSLKKYLVISSLLTILI